MQLTNKLVDIADSIRATNSSSNLMTIDEMPDNVDIAKTVIQGLLEQSLEGKFSYDYITRIAQYGLYVQRRITELDLPNCQAIGNSACYGCSALATAKLPKINRLEYQAMRGSGLVLLDLYDPDRESFPIAANVNILQDTPIASGNGYIIINDEYVDDMKANSTWSTYADQIIGNSDRATVIDTLAQLMQRQTTAINNRIDIKEELEIEQGKE